MHGAAMQEAAAAAARSSNAWAAAQHSPSKWWGWWRRQHQEPLQQGSGASQSTPHCVATQAEGQGAAGHSHAGSTSNNPDGGADACGVWPRAVAAAALACPWDLAVGADNWCGPDAGFSRLYDAFMGALLAALFRTHRHALDPALAAAHSAAAAPPDGSGEAAGGESAHTLTTHVKPDCGAGAAAVCRGQQVAAGQQVQGLERPAGLRADDAARALSVRDFDAAATIHWFGAWPCRCMKCLPG